MNIEDLDVYLVGGAVRDQLSGLPVKDRDWVVVGSSVDEMLALGFKPVGADFPVFIHPHNAQEYALARTERKTAKGYHGFIFNASPDVTLEQDLKRRDLTINAMAIDKFGHLIDPYSGQRDLANKVLRHVSEAFSEDPVRVLRTARFLARFAPNGFVIADETYALMHEMVDAGELDALVPERVWRELEAALQEPASEWFIRVLFETGALAVVLPDYDIDESGLRNLSELLPKYNACSNNALLKFSALFQYSSIDIETFCLQLRVPNHYRKVAMRLNSMAGLYLQLTNAITEDYLHLMQGLDVPRNPNNIALYIDFCQGLFSDVEHALIQKNINGVATALRHLDMGAALLDAQNKGDIAQCVIQIKTACIDEALRKASC